MARSYSSVPSKLARPGPRKDGDGNDIHNLILLGVAQTDCSSIFSSLEFVRLQLHQLLHEAGETIRSVYFTNHGLASVLSVQPDGKSVEVGLIGIEGFVGIPVVFGFKTSATRVVAQSEGTAYRIEADKLREFLPKCPKLALALQRYGMILASQSTQLAACNRLHEVEERLARWLLMSQDRIGGNTLPLTQEFLGQMLGTRRATVSVAASILQKAGMITYTRGNVTITDRAKLEEAACDCYAVIQRQSQQWQKENS